VSRRALRSLTIRAHILAGNAFGDDGAAALASALQENNTLTKLHVRGVARIFVPLQDLDAHVRLWNSCERSSGIGESESSVVGSGFFK